MKVKKRSSRILRWHIPVVALGMLNPLVAEEELDSFREEAIEVNPSRQQEEEAGLVDSNDKSGADPINFTFDARLYNEYQWLTAPGNAGRNITSFDLRSPSTDRGRQMAGPGELGDSSRRRSRGDRQVCQPGPAEEVEIREASLGDDAVVGGALDFAKAKANGKQQQQQGDARS